MPKTYDSEFRLRVVELVRSGRSVVAVRAELGLADATVYRSGLCAPSCRESGIGRVGKLSQQVHQQIRGLPAFTRRP